MVKTFDIDGMKAETGIRMNIIKDVTIEAPIPRAIEESKKLISSQLRDFQSLSSDGKFRTVPEYPEFAWLEGVVNALTHRDYSFRGDYVKVTMYDDRLEISSPGQLPNIVNLENMRATRYSRNPFISRVLAEFGWVQELNEGVKRIYEEMKMFFLKEPTYSEPNDNSVLLVLENNIVMRNIRISEYISKILSEDFLESLNQDQKSILNYAFSNGSITTAEAETVTGKKTTYCRNMLKKLVELGIFKWCGTSVNDPKQYYTFKDTKENTCS